MRREVGGRVAGWPTPRTPHASAPDATSAGGGGCQEKKASTDAALILRRFEGGWPWLLTKRICLGGGMVGLIAEAIAEAHSWQAHGGLLACQGEEGAGSWELALGRRATPTRRSPWTVEAAMRGAPGAVSLSLDFFGGGGGVATKTAVGEILAERGEGRGVLASRFDPLWGLGADLGGCRSSDTGGADRSRGRIDLGERDGRASGDQQQARSIRVIMQTTGEGP